MRLFISAAMLGKKNNKQTFKLDMFVLGTH